LSPTSENLDRLEVERREILQALFWEGDEGTDKSVLENRLHRIEDLIERGQQGVVVFEENERRDTEEQKRREAQLRETQLEDLNKLLEKKHRMAEQLDNHLYDVPGLIKEYLEMGRDAYASAQDLGMEEAGLCLSDDHLIGYLRALFWGVLPAETLEPGPVYKRRLADIETERRGALKP
jgi:hypothetical protein